jgi:triacylglycerol lipase
LRPDQVKSLWLLDALGCPSARHSEMFEQHRLTGRLPLIIRTPADFDECLRLVSSRPFWLPNSLRRRYAARAIVNADLHSKIADVISESSDDLTPSRDRIDVPALIVWGEQDRVLSPNCITEQCLVFPRNTVIRMPGIGHLPMVESPRQVAEDYRRFISSLEREPADPLSTSIKSTNR